MVVEYPAARGATAAAAAATANRGVVRVAVVSAASRVLAQENIFWLLEGVDLGQKLDGPRGQSRRTESK